MAQWGFPATLSLLKLSSTQTFQENRGEKEPKASWSFPAACFYSISQCACPWKERWGSLVKVCRVEQRLASHLKHILPNWHIPWHHRHDISAPFWRSTIVSLNSPPGTGLDVRNKEYFSEGDHTHRNRKTPCLLKTLITTLKTYKSCPSFRAFWTLLVICLTAIKSWKGTRGVFMKAIIACKDSVCLR